MKLYDNYQDITSEIINNLLVNQDVSITEEELEKLKAIPGVKFDLPLSDETYRAFIGLVGRPKTRIRKPGVYILKNFRRSYCSFPSIENCTKLSP